MSSQSTNCFPSEHSEIDLLSDDYPYAPVFYLYALLRRLGTKSGLSSTGNGENREFFKHLEEFFSCFQV